MNNPFENKAIKFETEQELNHLAELARGYGADVRNLYFEDEDCRYFRVNSSGFYRNCGNSLNHLPEITYSDFIASLQLIPTHMLTAEYCQHYVEKTCKDVKQGRTLTGWYVSFDNKVTPTVLTPDDSWRSAYDILVNPFTPNHTEQPNTKKVNGMIIDMEYKTPFMPKGEPIISTEQPDMVNHPPHYTVNGIEVIDVIENYKLNYKLGNVVKYILRSDLKGNRLQDLKKALWYLKREIEQSEKQTICTDTQ
jgi:hypothetical protein